MKVLQTNTLRKCYQLLMLSSCLLYMHALQAQTAYIGDFIWLEGNNNGVQDAFDQPLAGVTVELYSCSDLTVPVATTVSNGSGSYSFVNVQAGAYRVRFGNISGLNPTFYQIGFNGDLDSDIGPNGYSECILVADGDTMKSIDGGYRYCNPNGAMVCNDEIQVSLTADGTAELMPDDLLEGDNYCDNLFNINIITNNIPQNTNVLDCDDVNQIVKAVITRTSDGNFCEVDIVVSDNLPPFITGDDSLVVPCTEPSLDPDDIGGILVFDNCGISIVDYNDFVDDGDCSDPYTKKITRNWVVVDDEGNLTRDTQMIFLLRPSIDSIIFPPDVTLEACANMNSDPEHTGFPTLNGFPVENDNMCDITLFQFDLSADGNCVGESAILRRWTVLDDCTGDTRIYTQTIFLMDNVAPYLECPQDITVGTTNFDCTADVTLPEALVLDLCSPQSDIQIQVFSPVGNAIGNGATLENVPLGTYPITYRVTDDCGNTASCTFSLTVEDDDPPVAICDQYTSLSLGANGTGQVCWQTFDDGSEDNCGVLDFKVKRMDAPNNVGFTDCVSFDCSDIGQSIMIRLRVYDRIGDYSESDPLGRFNECMAEVAVFDKIGPEIECPESIVYTCTENFNQIPTLSALPTDGPPLFENGELVGYFTGAIDNCTVDSISLLELGSIPSCGEGSFNRLFIAYDANGNSSQCVQQVTVINNGEEFYINDTDCTNNDPSDGVIWPCDINASTCSNTALDPSVTGEPILQGNYCAKIGVGYEDFTFVGQGSGCLQVVRTWKITDWCQPDPSTLSGQKEWVYVQNIRIQNGIAPVFIEGCEDAMGCSYDPNCESGEIILEVRATDDCTAEEDLIYFYQIDLFSDGQGPIQGFDATSIANTGAFPVNVENQASGYYPIGTHRIYWTVTDGCGNVQTCSYQFTIEDCKEPTPIVKVITTNINPAMGMVMLTADMFNNHSNDNCTAEEDIILSFSPDPNDTLITFDCSQLGTQIIRIYAFDEAGNSDYVEFSINITDVNNFCNNNILISTAGLIETEDYMPVDQVKVSMTKNGQMQAENMSDDNGFYKTSAESGYSYTLTPYKNTHFREGISTHDLVLIAQHILKKNLLESPYKQIAADVNGDGKITTFDILTLRNVLLEITDGVQGNTSWRFVDRSYQFPEPHDAFATPFPEAIDLNDLQADKMDNDFVAIKVGDVNGLGILQENEADWVSLTAQDAFVHQGEETVVRFMLNEIEDMMGCQLALSYDPENLAFVALDEGNVMSTSFGMQYAESGRILMSHVNVAGMKEALYFELKFIALQDGNLSEMIAFDIDALVPEAYYNSSTQGFSIRPIDLTFLGGVTTATTRTDLQQTILEQNEPNPFAEYTYIDFTFEVPTSATLRIQDVSGKLVGVWKGEYKAGTHQLRIDHTDLPGAGLYFYTLQAGVFTETKKMVLLE